MIAWIRKRWFLTALAAVLIVGLWASADLLWLSQWRALRYAIVATVLFLMALPLEARTVVQAVRRPLPSLLGSTLNLGVLPALAWFVVSMSGALFDTDTARGILVAATAPCTLASASVWTRRAGGNDAIAMMVTVITNLVCFVVTPLWLLCMTGAEAQIDLAPMVTKLGLVVLLPMLLAQTLRYASRWVAREAVRRKSVLSVLAQCGILCMVLMGATQTGHRLSVIEHRPAWWDWIYLFVLVGGLHTVVLFAGRAAARGLRMADADGKAVAVAGSQKTLMVGLQVAMELGWSIVPMVAYHVSQLIIDTWITDRWRTSGD